MRNGAEGRGSGDLVRIAGAMTLRRAAELKAVLVDALAKADRVAIDLGEVTDVDLCGLQLLCALQRTASESQKGLVFVGLVPDVFRRAAEEAGLCIRTGCGAEDPGKCPWKGGRTDG